MLPPPIPPQFGPQYEINLTGVNTIGGSGYNALCAVPTLPLVTGIVVDFINTGITPNATQRWQLQAYTGQSGPGTAQPNDFNIQTNARIWIQIA
jgi:hypothetical protein